MKPGENCLHVTPHFLQSKLIFKFRWTGLTITIFTVKMPQGSYKRTKYAVNLRLYCVQLCGFVPAAKLPNGASSGKAAFFQKLSVTMLCLSLGFRLFLSFLNMYNCCLYFLDFSSKFSLLYHPHLFSLDDFSYVLHLFQYFFLFSPIFFCPPFSKEKIFLL